MNQWFLLWFLLSFFVAVAVFGIHFTENGMWFQKPYVLTSWLSICIIHFCWIYYRTLVPLKPCKFNHSSILSRIFVIRSYLFIIEYHESFALFRTSSNNYFYMYTFNASKHRKFIVFRHVLIFVSNRNNHFHMNQ